MAHRGAHTFNFCPSHLWIWEIFSPPWRIIVLDLIRAHRHILCTWTWNLIIYVYKNYMCTVQACRKYWHYALWHNALSCNLPKIGCLMFYLDSKRVCTLVKAVLPTLPMVYQPFSTPCKGRRHRGTPTKQRERWATTVLGQSLWEPWSKKFRHLVVPY